MIKLMRMRVLTRYGRPTLFAVLLAFASAPVAFAQTSSNSSNYEASEMQFGGGSALESCSGSYCARASIGDMTAGNSTDGKTTASFGPITSEDPLLEVIVEPGESNLGILSADSTASKTTSIRIRNNLTNGYTLQIMGEAPKFGDHRLATPSEPTASDPGTEQFGINVVANTTPSVGANLVHDPADQLVFGEVEPGYDIPNQFMYSSGAVIARGLTDWGRTDYTVSMIINVSNTTPAGHYTSDFSAVVIPAF